MAKLTLEQKLKALDKLSDNYNKGKENIMCGRIGRNQELRDRLKVKFIKTPSFRLNDAMGGGFAKSRISIVSGLPDSGKTFLILETIALEMKKDPGFVVYWLESEGSLSDDNLIEMGIDLDRFYYDQIEREGAAEDVLNKMEGVIAQGLVDMCVINSLKALTPSEEMQKGMDKMQVGLQARMNSKLMRKIIPIVTDNDIALIMTQHLSVDIGSMSRDYKIV